MRSEAALWESCWYMCIGPIKPSASLFGGWVKWERLTLVLIVATHSARQNGVRSWHCEAIPCCGREQASWIIFHCLILFITCLTATLHSPLPIFQPLHLIRDKLFPHLQFLVGYLNIYALALAARLLEGLFSLEKDIIINEMAATILDWQGTWQENKPVRLQRVSRRPWLIVAN